MTRATKKARTNKPDASAARKRLAARHKRERENLRDGARDISSVYQSIADALSKIRDSRETQPASIQWVGGSISLHGVWDVDGILFTVTIS